jgi:hypothetical protein
MSHTVSPSSSKLYGVARVAALWGVARSSIYAARHRRLDELRTAVYEFRDRYNHHWILQRLNNQTPAQRDSHSKELISHSQRDSMTVTYSHSAVHQVRSNTGIAAGWENLNTT